MVGARSPKYCIPEGLCHAETDLCQAFPARTEGSVKKHWYKVTTSIVFIQLKPLTHMQDMHYAEFAEDEV
jgi:hypothetical protein